MPASVPNFVATLMPATFVNSPAVARMPGRAAVCCLVAAVYDGMSRGEAARIGGMDRQTLRDWVHRLQRRGTGWPHQPQGRGPDFAT